ncbi:MAG: YceI family protein [Anaerolineae bacterium]|nr:YceI family protein [Anaerolineae bacterium]
MRKIQILIGTVALIGIGGISSFLYFTREIAAPSQDIQANVQRLEVSSEADDTTLFRIVPDETQAEYNIAEVLNGSDKLVVGTTNEVAGDILLNLQDLSQSQIGEISINARTFATDDERRDNSVARFVLQSESDDYELIVFQPISISGLPDSASTGDTLEFQVSGDLTVTGVTQPITFDVTTTLETEDQLIGHAETTITRSDFSLSIPDVPFVASVEDELTLKLDFVANTVTSSTVTET